MWNKSFWRKSLFQLVATSVGKYVLFAGGGGLNLVDIWDSSNGMWNTTTLPQPKTWLSATSIGDYALFGPGGISNIVDIWHAPTKSWSMELSNVWTVALFFYER